MEKNWDLNFLGGDTSLERKNVEGINYKFEEDKLKAMPPEQELEALDLWLSSIEEAKIGDKDPDMKAFVQFLEEQKGLLVRKAA